MKYLVLILGLIWGSASNTLSVKDYGATGNGTSDDTRAINSCLAAAHAQSKNVFFPAGTYLCNEEDINANLLIFDAGGTHNITIYGPLINDTPAAKILTTKDTASTQLLVNAFSPCTNLTITCLSFSNTHGKINFITDAIFLQGTSGECIYNPMISSCKFNGYSQAIAGQGIIKWTITDNNFGAPNGHDNGLQNTQPCVDIWMFDNGNGYCDTVLIQKNNASGFTGTLPMSCKRPLDGFLYGAGYNITATGNTTSNFSEELYLIQPWGTNHDTTAKTIIQGNTIDCHLPPGCKQNDGSPHKINYAIRCDASNSIITGNTIYNYTWGIMVYGPSYPTLSLKNYTVANNKLYTALATDTNYAIQRGIIIQGNSNPITGVNVHDNEAHLTDTAFIQFVAVTSPQNANNRYWPANKKNRRAGIDGSGF